MDINETVAALQAHADLMERVAMEAACHLGAIRGLIDSAEPDDLPGIAKRIADGISDYSEDLAGMAPRSATVAALAQAKAMKFSRKVKFGA